MSGMVFPQSPAPEKPGQASDSQSVKTKEKSGDSEFDAVSRQEQVRAEKHLEARRQKRAEHEDRVADARSRDANAKEARNEDRQTRQVEEQAETSEATTGETADAPRQAVAEGSGQPGDAGEQDPALLNVEADATAMFTFADLQAMVANNPAGTGRTGGETPAVGSEQGTKPLTPPTQILSMTALEDGDGAAGKAGSTVAMLVDGLANTSTGEPGKTAELPVARLMSNADLGSQVVQSAAGQKVAEQAVALRGYATSIDLPVGHAEWGDKLVGKLTWLTANNMSSAEIHLTPADMGPLDVRVNLHRDQATVTVHSANPVVRDQLELHSHRLRDMLGDQGIDLDRFEVADREGQSGGQWGSQSDGESTNGGDQSSATLASDEGGSEGTDIIGGSLDLSWKGEVDLYA